MINGRHMTMHRMSAVEIQPVHIQLVRRQVSAIFSGGSHLLERREKKKISESEQAAQGASSKWTLMDFPTSQITYLDKQNRKDRRTP